jgi:hypothetical protein
MLRQRQIVCATRLRAMVSARAIGDKWRIKMIYLFVQVQLEVEKDSPNPVDPATIQN